TTSPVTTPTHAEVQRGSQMRALAGMAVVALALTVLIAFLRESVQTRRRAKATAAQDVEEVVEDFDDDEPVDEEEAPVKAAAPVPVPATNGAAPKPAAQPTPAPAPQPVAQPKPNPQAAPTVKSAPVTDAQRSRPPMRRPRVAEETQRIKPIPNPDHVAWPRTELEVSARPSQRD
ncbi:MAG: hypothetical protein ABWY11_17045, partial [Umezawaea sp.]